MPFSKFWDSYFYCTRRERKGILLLLLLLIIINGSAELYCYLHSRSDPFALSPQLQREWDTWLRENRSSSEKPGDHSGSCALHPFPFDPNLLDSSGFIALGLPPQRVRSLLNWRRKGKIFRTAAEFAQLRGLSPAQFDTLRPYIMVSGSTESSKSRYEEKPLPAEIDLNTVDSATLVRLDGIGPYLAGKIVHYRESLGTFIKNDQLKEIYHFPDSVLLRLQKQLVIRPLTIRRIPLNSIDEESLARHPYIGPQMAKNIILLRSGLRKYDDIEQLQQVPLMNDEKYRKIAPYCIIE